MYWTTHPDFLEIIHSDKRGEMNEIKTEKACIWNGEIRNSYNINVKTSVGRQTVKFEKED